MDSGDVSAFVSAAFSSRAVVAQAGRRLPDEEVKVKMIKAAKRASEAADFLYCSSPTAWVEAAAVRLPELRIDHANCEKKAAGTALNLMFRYTRQHELLMRLSKLAREELRHFEQVSTLLRARDIKYVNVPAARYAGGLRREVRTLEPARLIDLLIVGAVVEARSCERFEVLQTVLDSELATFYAGLAESEARHFLTYLDLATALTSETDLRARMATFLEVEAQLISEPDPGFGFHSGPPSM